MSCQVTGYGKYLGQGYLKTHLLVYYTHTYHHHNHIGLKTNFTTLHFNFFFFKGISCTQGCCIFIVKLGWNPFVFIFLLFPMLSSHEVQLRWFPGLFPIRLCPAPPWLQVSLCTRCGPLPIRHPLQSWVGHHTTPSAAACAPWDLHKGHTQWEEEKHGEEREIM